MSERLGPPLQAGRVEVFMDGRMRRLREGEAEQWAREI